MGWLFDHNASNYVSRSSVNFGLNGATAISYACWFKLTALDASLEQRLVHKQISDGWNSFNLRFLTNTSRIAWGVENQSTGVWPSVNTVNDIGTGAWHRILCTWNRSAGTSADFVTYVDGVAVSQNFTANSYSGTHTIEESSNNYYFGLRPLTLNCPLDGAMAWVCVWNRQLSAQEALLDYWNPMNVTNGLISRVPLGDDDRDAGILGGSMSVTGTLRNITGSEPIHDKEWLTRLRPRPLAPGLAR